MTWNNFGYQEIATSMQAVGVTVVGCDPTPPDFEGVAQSYGMPFWRCGPDVDAFASILKDASRETSPTLVEIRAPNLSRRA